MSICNIRRSLKQNMSNCDRTRLCTKKVKQSTRFQILGNLKFRSDSIIQIILDILLCYYRIGPVKGPWTLDFPNFTVIYISQSHINFKATVIFQCLFRVAQIHRHLTRWHFDCRTFIWNKISKGMYYFKTSLNSSKYLLNCFNEDS